jgi:5-methylcytosine-specific restriction endonuclease McrA
MTKRERIYSKFNGLCAYSGTPLEDDWQIDHIKPIARNDDGTCMFPEDDCEDNMVPAQRLINHYKHSMPLETFRNWYMAGLHERITKLPKNPKTEKSIKRSEYLLRVAAYFGITPDQPFDGEFYFEKTKPTP